MNVREFPSLSSSSDGSRKDSCSSFVVDVAVSSSSWRMSRRPPLLYRSLTHCIWSSQRPSRRSRYALLTSVGTMASMKDELLSHVRKAGLSYVPSAKIL